ncbi:LuxR C-terminal-related transcriptional regulator [Kitasatospora sp. NPDC059795]|uniref:helix-turn-helix transcriptional regulator n=1 Tax=Kitasatospora sp. NPDC059795 TaxID=3346949 RepID=UPI00365BC1A4
MSTHPPTGRGRAPVTEPCSQPQQTRTVLALAAQRFEMVFSNAPQPTGWSPALVDTFGFFVRGLSYARIGAELEIAPGTVKQRIGQFHRHLGTRDRQMAALAGLAHRVVPVEAVASPMAWPQSLSPEEVELLVMRASGLSSREVAVHVGVPVNTLKVHLQRLREKLGMPSLFRAVVVGAANGLIDVPGVPRLRAASGTSRLDAGLHDAPAARSCAPRRRHPSGPAARPPVFAWARPVVMTPLRPDCG